MTASVLEVRARVSRRRSLVVSAVLAALLLLAMLSLSIGDYPIAPADVWTTLWGGGDRVQSYVIFQVRAPRLVHYVVRESTAGVNADADHVVATDWLKPVEPGSSM